MKIVITLLRKNGKCRSWTNATPCEHTSMCLIAYVDAINRLVKTWNMIPAEVTDRISDIIKQEKEGARDNERTREDFGRDRKRAEQLRG